MAKGGNFEREMSKYLSHWLSEGKRDDILWRTDGSGARSTTRLKQGKKTANSGGDFALLDPDHSLGKKFMELFHLEAKRGYSKDIDVLQFIDKGKAKKKDPLLIEWWKKYEKEKVENNKEYLLLIFKRDRHEVCVMFDGILYEEILDFHKGRHLGNFLVYCEDLYVTRLDNFLDWFTVNILEAL